MTVNEIFYLLFCLQCIENLHYSDLLNSSMWESSSVTMPQSVRYTKHCNNLKLNYFNSLQLYKDLKKKETSSPKK